MMFDIDIASLAGYFPHPTHVAAVIVAYAVMRGIYNAFVTYKTAFDRIDSAHSRLDNHKREIESYLDRIDARIAEIQREIKEMYQLLVTKAGA